jgi:hypothetical protein
MCVSTAVTTGLIVLAYEVFDIYMKSCRACSARENKIVKQQIVVFHYHPGQGVGGAGGSLE